MAAFTMVVQTDADISATQLAQTLDKSGKHQAMKALRALLRKVESGNQPAYLTTQVASAFASATVTCTQASAVDGTDEVVIAGTTLAVEAAPANQSEFLKGASNAAFATNLAACINAHTVLQKIVRAKAVTNVCTITCRIPSPLGNLITLTETGNGMVVSGALFTGGASDEADSFVYGFDATA